jgi:hypothetical protein
MGFTYSICPRCGGDFMFHNSDYHLERKVICKKKKKVKYQVICQDCDEIEVFVKFFEDEMATGQYESIRGVIHKARNLFKIDREQTKKKEKSGKNIVDLF